MVQQRADIAVLARGAAAEFAAPDAEEILVAAVVLRLEGGIGGFGFDGGQADGGIVQIAVFGGFGQREQGAAAGVGVAAGESEVGEAAADVDVQRFGQRGKVAVKRAAQALQNGVVDIFKRQVDGMAHGVFLRRLSGCLKAVAVRFNTGSAPRRL